MHRADMLDPGSLNAIGDGNTTAYYLVHSMGRGGDTYYEQRDEIAAGNFARFATAVGVERVLYLGGLGDNPMSKHLRSRLRVGEILRGQGPPLTWFRAGMVVGGGSESYRTLRSLVERLPVMLAPSWLSTPTQAIAIADVVRYLLMAPGTPQTRFREIQIGSAEVLTYGRCSIGWPTRWDPPPPSHTGAGMALFDFQPRSFEQALREAIAEEADRALTPSS